MKFRHGFVPILLMACAASPAVAAPDCAAISDAVVDGQKMIALLYAQASRSGPARIDMTPVYASEVQANLHLLVAHRCPLPEKPIRWQQYTAAAFRCASAPPGNSPECDRKTWTTND